MVSHVQESISSLLSENEWKVLRQFCERARRLAATRLASDNPVISGKIEYDREKGLRFEAELPPKEQIAEFLMEFRFFYLQNEPTHFLKILRLIGRHANSPDVREVLKVFRRQWNDSLFRKAFEIKFNDKPITTSLLIDLWFNAEYFHSDDVKGRELKKLKDIFSDEFAKYMLLDAAFEATKIVFKVLDGLQEMVEKHFGVQSHQPKHGSEKLGGQ
jgi:hypothetical protein